MTAFTPNPEKVDLLVNAASRKYRGGMSPRDAVFSALKEEGPKMRLTTDPAERAEYVTAILAGLGKRGGEVAAERRPPTPIPKHKTPPPPKKPTQHPPEREPEFDFGATDHFPPKQERPSYGRHGL